MKNHVFWMLLLAGLLAGCSLTPPTPPIELPPVVVEFTTPTLLPTEVPTINAATATAVAPTSAPTATPEAIIGLHTADVVGFESFNLEHPPIPVGELVTFRLIEAGELKGRMALVWNGRAYYFKGVEINYYPWKPNEGFEANSRGPRTEEVGYIEDYSDFYTNGTNDFEADSKADRVYITAAHGWTELEDELLDIVRLYINEAKAANQFQLNYFGADCSPGWVRLDGKELRPAPIDGLIQMESSTGVLEISQRTCEAESEGAELELAVRLEIKAGDSVNIGQMDTYHETMEEDFLRDPWWFCTYNDDYMDPAWQPEQVVSRELQQRCGIYSRSDMRFSAQMKRLGFHRPYAASAFPEGFDTWQFYGEPNVAADDVLPAHSWTASGNELPLNNGETLKVYTLEDGEFQTQLEYADGSAQLNALGYTAGIGRVYLLVPEKLDLEADFDWKQVQGFRIVEELDGQPAFETLVWE